MGTANRKAMIQLTIDVDYPYPSRVKSFLCTILYTIVKLELKLGKDYLKNSKTIARMVNESKREVKAYWFFTPTTTPDEKLLQVLGEEKHEVALHITTNPNAELKLLEKATKRKINYYTIHGTARLLGQVMWRRKLGQNRIKVPKDFPLKYFYGPPPVEVDVWCADKDRTLEEVVKKVEDYIAKGEVLHIHPEWLFNRGTITKRGPIYETLKRVLNVDGELATLVVRKKGFARIAHDAIEYQRDFVPANEFTEKLKERGIDIFTFIERKWCYTIPKPSNTWVRTEDNVALLQVTTYDQWWESIGKKTRNMVRKAEKSGVKTEVSEPNEKLAEGIWNIYNETPIRQERAFPHYGESMQTVEGNVLSAQECTFIGAFLQDELAGFIQLSHGDKIAIISQILSLQRDADKAVNNALVAKAVEVCAAKQIGWLMYGRVGNHPSLDKFKQSNGFAKYPLTRYYVPLTRKGKLTVKLGLHREVKDTLPQSIKYPLIPVFNWISRTKMKAKRARRSR